MAAAGNGAMFDELSRILEYLSGIYTLAKRKKETESQVIKDSKELLKPWPKKKTKRTETVKDEVEKQKDKEAREKTEMETQMLNEVELMLAKAKKTRDVLAKADEKVQLSRNKKPIKIKSNLETQNMESRSQSLRERNADYEAGVISQSELSKLLAGTKIKSGSVNPKKTLGAPMNKERNPSVTAVKKDGTKNLLIDEKRSKSKAIVKIPPVTRKNYSTSASEIGKHSKRPVSKITSSYSQKALSAKSANERTRIGDTNRQQSTIKSASGRTRIMKNSSTKGNQTAQNVQLLARKMIKNSTNQSNNNGDGIDDAISTKSDDVIDAESGDLKYTDIDDVRINSSKIKSDVDPETSVKNTDIFCGEDEEEEETPFLLKTDGSKLKFPSHFQKLCNTRERHISRLSEVISRSERTPECQQFLNRVNSELLGTDECFSLYDHDMRYQRLKQEYEHLIEITNQQLKTLQEESDGYSLPYLHKVKETMETIQKRSEKLEKEINDFKQKEQRFCNMKKMKLKTEVNTQKTCNLPSTFFLSPDNQDVLDDIFPKGFSQVNIEYSNLDELQRLVSLQIELQMLHVEEQTQKILSEDLLPLLASMDKKDPEFIQCYRSIYGLLCHNGEQFPTMIADEEETKSEIDEQDTY